MGSSPSDADPELWRRIRGVRLIAFDFDGVFTDNAVYISSDGVEFVRCWRGDGIGLSALRRIGVETVAISSEPSTVVSKRCEKLRLRCIHGVDDKRAVLEAVLAEMGLTVSQAAFMGNDINDLPCLTIVGLAIVVPDAHPAVRYHGRYCTRTLGGYGAVREVCDLFVRVLSEQSTGA